MIFRINVSVTLYSTTELTTMIQNGIKIIRPEHFFKKYQGIGISITELETSIIGEELAAREALGVLNLFKTQYKIKNDIKKKQQKNQETKTEEIQTKPEQLSGILKKKKVVNESV